MATIDYCPARADHDYTEWRLYGYTTSATGSAHRLKRLCVRCGREEFCTQPVRTEPVRIDRWISLP